MVKPTPRIGENLRELQRASLESDAFWGRLRSRSLPGEHAIAFKIVGA